MSDEKVEVTEELQKRFLCNDRDHPLTWDEWQALHDFYYDLERKLALLGRDFYLAKKEADRRLSKVHFIKEQMQQRDKKLAGK